MTVTSLPAAGKHDCQIAADRAGADYAYFHWSSRKHATAAR